MSSVSKDRFAIEQEGSRIPVMGAPEELAPGDGISDPGNLSPGGVHDTPGTARQKIAEH